MRYIKFAGLATLMLCGTVRAQDQYAAVAVVHAHARGVREIALSGNNRLASIGNDHALRVWELPSLAVAWEQSSGFDQASVAFSQNSNRVLWIDPESKTLNQKMLEPGQEPVASPIPAAESPRSSDIDTRVGVAAYAEKSGNMYFLSTIDGTSLSTIPSGENLLGVYLTPNEQECIVPRTAKLPTQEDRKWNVTLELTNIATGSVSRSFVGHEDLVNDVCVSSSSGLMFSASGAYFSFMPGAPSPSPDASVRIWNLQTGEQTGRLHLESPAEALAISDNDLLAVGTREEVRLYDANSRAQLVNLVGLNGRVVAVDISPDGSIVVAGSLLGDIGVWDLTSYAEAR